MPVWQVANPGIGLLLIPMNSNAYAHARRAGFILDRIH
jgi:hypothetical protein